MRSLRTCLFVLSVLLGSTAAHAATIFVGPFPDLNPAPAITIPPDTFLVPVEVSGATNLQLFQFDLLFNPAVVQEVDPFDGSSGIYGAEFVRGDASTQSFILGGFPFNSLGLVDDVTGSYPGLLDGVTGDGVLSYILFTFVAGQETNNPGFSIANASINGSPIAPPSRVPEPSVLMLLLAGVLLVSKFRRI